MPHLISPKKPYFYLFIGLFLFIGIFLFNYSTSYSYNCNTSALKICNQYFSNWIKECTDCDVDPGNEWCNTIDCAQQGKTCINGTCQVAPPVPQNCTDSDNDGYGVCPNCGIAKGCMYNGDDCDDLKGYINPGSSETCDTFDNDCNSQTDEGCDDDNDGYCDNSMQIYNNTSMCSNTVFTSNGMSGDDCNDTDTAINPGKTDICGNGIDEDCSGSDSACAPCTITNAYWSQSTATEGNSVLLIITGANCDGKQVNFQIREDDLFGGDDWPVSQPANQAFIGNTASTNWIAEYQPDGFLGLNDPPEYYFIASLVSNANINLDSKNNPLLKVSKATSNCTDTDSDGYGVCPNCDTANGCAYNGNDCNDADNAVNPGATEICGNGIDEDCSGGDLACLICTDNDNDGYGVCPNCDTANGCVYNGNDCNDADNAVNPGATEICGNGIDEDCSGSDLSCSQPTGIIFEDDFSDDPNWVESSTVNYECSNAPQNWDCYKLPGGGADMRVVAGGQNGTPMMRYGYQWGGGASSALVLSKHLTGNKNTGYNELYIRYQVKLDSAFRAGDGRINYWKWLRLFQDITPGNINQEAENDPPQDTRFIVITASNNPPRWGGMFNTNRNNPSNGGSSYKISFNPSNCQTPTSGCFEAIQEWRFDKSTGILDNPTPQNWHTIEWHIKLSSADCNYDTIPGPEDGVFEMWIDGVKQTSSLRYSQKNGENKICSAIPTMQYNGGINWINVFDNMGGWSNEWTAQRYVYLDNVVISDSYIGPNYVIGSGP